MYRFGDQQLVLMMWFLASIIVLLAWNTLLLWRDLENRLDVLEAKEERQDRMLVMTYQEQMSFNGDLAKAINFNNSKAEQAIAGVEKNAEDIENCR